MQQDASSQFLGWIIQELHREIHARRRPPAADQERQAARPAATPDHGALDGLGC